MRQDDRVATLQWDFDPNQPVRELPPGVTGYQVTWGPASQPEANVRLTEHRIIQLQPLVNGQAYQARVRAVDSYGRLSSPSAPITFTGDASRVDALRTRMNGFFDDFNLAEGAADERKWNTAFSICNGAWANTYFINTQFHVHNTISTVDGNCDRGQQINRARVPLDLSDNGTRTIVFDFDGVFRRNHWYIDLVPRLVDIAGPEKYEPGTLRFTQHGQMLSISIFDESGSEVPLKETNWNPYPPMDWAGVAVVPNVRRHWEIRLRKDYAEIRIDGKLVLATDPGAFQLPSDRYHVLWSTFGYNTDKANQPLVLAHWDNFGFDAPASKTPTVVTHNYKVVNSGTDFISAIRSDNSSPATVKLNIPDQVRGAVERRLMFTLQMKDFSAYEWRASDRVVVNGRALAIPQPATNTNPPRTDLVGLITPYTVVLPLPEGVLKQGENTLVFDTESSGIHNIHIELDFSIDSAPLYTLPGKAAKGAVILAMPAVGPNLVITQIGSHAVDRDDDQLSTPAHFNPTVSGVIPVTVEVHNDTALEATGTNAGVVLIELLVDKRVVLTQRTDSQSPAPAARYTFNLDTRLLTNGTHQMYARAYSPQCIPSIADYGGVGGTSGYYFPIHVTVQNGGGTTGAASIDLMASGAYMVRLPLVLGGAGSSGSAAICTGGAKLLGVDNPAVPTLQSTDRRLDPAPFGRFFVCQ